ncbi:flavodoxin family protein [Ruminiclostridium cellobioparum]|uniref:flavodoxin family protein n=1 Tax=Ruminiclostridium cellobioparum TaxID=29355 RepID=UPI000486A80E|nr:NAD(P)H-dependent oxidoreductase [Ruminiclostridium cellobioparum]
MKICVIHGSPRKGNTYKTTQIFMEQLRKNAELEIVEFYLPRALPYFCCGCCNCYDESADKCPHAQYTQPIEQAMKEADGLVLTSPVYVLAESGVIKSFMDHFGYIYLPHRPMEEMFSKVAMVISTTAGAGTGKAIKAVSRTLRYWGVKRIYSLGLTVSTRNWEDMKAGKQIKLQKLIGKKADMFHKALVNRKKIPATIFIKFMFIYIKKVMRDYEDGHTDKKYWLQKGWLTGQNKPF